MNITSTRFERGTIREDGKLFWGYLTSKASGKADREWWITPDNLRISYCRRIYSAAKNRAKGLGLPFDLTVDYLENILPQDLLCPIMGYQMTLVGGRNTAASLDKIIPHLGYVKSNVIWMSLEANRIKDNASLEVLKRLVRLMETHG
jgi:hypothetical protein